MNKTYKEEFSASRVKKEEKILLGVSNEMVVY